MEDQMTDYGLPEFHEPGPEWDGLVWPTGFSDPYWRAIQAITWALPKKEPEQYVPDPSAKSPIPCPARGGENVIAQLKAKKVWVDGWAACRRNTCGVCGAITSHKTVKAIGFAPVVQRVVLEPKWGMPGGAGASAKRLRAATKALLDAEMSEVDVSAVSVYLEGGKEGLLVRMLTRGTHIPAPDWEWAAMVYELRVVLVTQATTNTESEARWLLEWPLLAYEQSSDANASLHISAYASLNGGRILTTHGKFWKSPWGSLKDVREARRLVERQWDAARKE
jgi:hypothetical protein